MGAASAPTKPLSVGNANNALPLLRPLLPHTGLRNDILVFSLMLTNKKRHWERFSTKRKVSFVHRVRQGVEGALTVLDATA